MLRQRNLLMVLPFTVLSLMVACKKDAHQDPIKPLAPRIKTVSFDNDLRTYTYDSKGRVTKIVFSLYGRDEYSYTNTAITRTHYDLADTVTSAYVYKLDAKGMAIGFTSTSTPDYIYAMSYTAAGELSTNNEIHSKAGQPDRSWDKTYYYTNNNLDSVATAYNDGTNTSTVKDYFDEYYTDKVNTIGNDNYGQAWLGASSRNALKAARDIGSDNTGFQPQTTYQYEYDSQSRITKQLRFEGSSAFSPIIFTYY
jgi:hypothetical protein